MNPALALLLVAAAIVLHALAAAAAAHADRRTARKIHYDRMKGRVTGNGRQDPNGK